MLKTERDSTGATVCWRL